MMTFGIVFDPKWAVAGAAVSKVAQPGTQLARHISSMLTRPLQVDLAIDTHLRVHGHASVSSQQNFEYCIGAEAGYDAFARITAP